MLNISKLASLVSGPDRRLGRAGKAAFNFCWKKLFSEKECKKNCHVLMSWQIRKRGNEKCPEAASKFWKEGI